MKNFNKILVVYNSKTDNRSLFNQAVELAQRNQATLMVIDVIEESLSRFEKPVDRESVSEGRKPDIPIIEEISLDDAISPNPESQVEAWNDLAEPSVDAKIFIQEYIIQEENRSLQQFVTAFRNAGIKTDSKTLYGVPFIEIIKEVLRNQYDLVMITAEGIEGLKGALFGSTTLHLMRKCPCPIWVIKPDQPRQVGRILAAVDLVQDDKERAALANKIMDLATSIAQSGQSELLIVHVWKMYGESIIRGRGGLSDQDIEKLLQETKNAHRQWLIELLQKYQLENFKYKVYLLKGEAGTLITELAEAKAVDLIVMGTVSRAGIAGFLIGNTAEKVLQKVNCSLLTVKPDGFVSPVLPDQA